MRARELQSSFLGRISIRRNQIASMEDQDSQMDHFQKNISERFTNLVNTNPPHLLSIAWLRNLLDLFLCCEAEFKAILIINPHPSHLLTQLLDRFVKALDILNALMHGLDCMQLSKNLAQTAVTALSRRPLCPAHVRRAKKALSSLLATLTMQDSKDAACKSAQRSWSASKQIHAMGSNLVAPRGAEGAGIYMMSSVTVFVMWAMVAALPCQERNGLGSHFPVSKQLSWAREMVVLHERIGEEWKKKEKSGTAGLLDEMQRMDKLGRSLFEFTDRFRFSVDEDVTVQVGELAEICRKMEEGIVPLQMQIREVFHRIVKSRAEFLDALEQAGKSSATSV